MRTYDCDDFRVAFEPAGAGSYRVVARAADGREARSTFAMPMTTDRLEHAVLQLGTLRSREVAPEMISTIRANAEELGGELGRALFDDTLGPFYDDARRAAADKQHGVRLTLSLAPTPELLSVPWELLYRRPTFLASQRRTPIVRHLEIGRAPPPASIERTVRILGVVASPRGLTPLDVQEERTRVVKALAGMVARGLVELDWCDPATPRTLRECLRDGSYHVLHYVGHSDFSEGAGLLFLEDEEGGPAQVTDGVLTNLLGDQDSLRLAILNSCEGARTTLTDPFAGIATSLVALGVPAVVAMQFAISDRAAIVFAEELFTSLIARQYPIDAAVSEARKAVFTEVNEIEWATPVLFMQSADGQLFDFTAEPQALPLPAPPTPITVDAPQPPVLAAPSRRRRAPIAAVAGAVAAAIVAVTLFAFTRSDDGDTRIIVITPTSGAMGTTVEMRGDPCPDPPESSVDGGIAYWMNASLDGATHMIANGDVVVDRGEPWRATIVVPVDDAPGARFDIGAACWSRSSQGVSGNYFEYANVPFDVTSP